MLHFFSFCFICCLHLSLFRSLCISLLHTYQRWGKTCWKDQHRFFISLPADKMRCVNTSIQSGVHDIIGTGTISQIHTTMTRKRNETTKQWNVILKWRHYQNTFKQSEWECSLLMQLSKVRNEQTNKMKRNRVEHFPEIAKAYAFEHSHRVIECNGHILSFNQLAAFRSIVKVNETMWQKCIVCKIHTKIIEIRVLSDRQTFLMCYRLKLQRKKKLTRNSLQYQC